MMEVTAPPADLVLDPFAYVPDMGSRVEGLGGQDRPAEGDYIFHTSYVAVAEGPAHFTLRFTGLEATQGVLNIRVHMLTDASRHAKLATAERIAFNRLVLNGGVHTIRFEAFQNALYALYGGLVGKTDARAVAAEVILDRPFDPVSRREVAAEARNTDFGGNTRPAAHIISLRSPSLGAPTCQFATASQLNALEDGGAFAHSSDPLTRWRAAYLIRTLECYGLLEPGAHGVGLGGDAAQVAAEIAAKGPSVDVIISPEEPDFGGLPAGQGEMPGFAPQRDVLHPISQEIVNYDFLWTNGLADHVGSVADGIRWIDSTTACLRPGGFAVHIVEYDPLERGQAFVRNDIERIILNMISRGHEVAELKIDSEDLLVDRRGISACGIISREAALG